MTPPESLLWIGLGSVAIALCVAAFVHWVLPFLDRLTSRHVTDLQPVLTNLDIDQRYLPVALRWWVIAQLAVVVLVGIVLMSPLLAAPLLLLVYLLPRVVLFELVSRRRQQLRDQLVNGAQALANTTRAGLTLPQGMEAILRETPDPLARVFRRIVADFHRGRPFAEPLREAQQRLQLEGFTLFASALLVCLERGGKVTEALERISRSLQENQRLERKLEADTASGRMTIRVLLLCPVGFLGLFYLIDPLGTSLLFTTLLGQLILFVAACLVYLAVWWAQSILKLNAPR
jgi:tight adherence protein B